MSRLVIIASMITLLAAVPAAFAGGHMAAYKHGIGYRGITMRAPKQVLAKTDGSICYNVYTGAANVCGTVKVVVRNNYPFRSGVTVSCQGYVDELNGQEMFNVTLGPQQHASPSFNFGYDTSTGSPSKLTLLLICNDYLLSWETRTIRVVYRG